MTEILITK